jgi:aldehyde:ferredoxin oxidoreductase
MKGWFGKILRVDLTNEAITREEVDQKVGVDFLGGRGWAIKYMMDEMDPAVDPYDPRNMLVFATGPLTGTPAPTGNRYMVVTKSPLTNALSASNSGGHFPTELKRTGFDMIIFTGRASKPVYLWVDEGEAEIRSAEHLWGKTVPETEDRLKEETDSRARVACIGPAGENLVKFASIMNDKHRAAGRSGVGAVMGSKNLKAVVVRGTRVPELAQHEAMHQYSRKLQIDIGKSSKESSLRLLGTAYVPPITNELGILPTRNFQTGRFEGVDGINGHVLREKYLKRAKACFRCPIACGRETEVNEPGYEGKGEGPEYETIGALGSGCGVDNLAAVAKANYLCNELGIDTISAGMTIACAMEMYERGLIPESDIGKPLRFGDGEFVIELVEQIAYRKGFGDALAEGSYRLATKYGYPEYSITAKKLEFPGYDPRGAKGMGLLYATSNIGASHMAGDIAYSEVFGVPEKIDPLTPEGKPWLIYRWEDAFVIIDATGLCVFLSVRNLFDPDVKLWPTRLTKMMNYATGAGYTPETLLKAAERVYNLERLFLLKAGFTREDDTLPKRMLEEPLPEGPGKGQVVELDQMLPEYYRLRGWDENGVPTAEKLEELGLSEYGLG